ncbi:MAG: iron-containing alcohol dehydrogenase, partial [Candidatus Brocadiia bacterium]
MKFEFATATQIIFGNNTFSDIGTIAAKMGSKALVVTDSRIDSAKELYAKLDKSGLKHVTYNAEGEPTTVSSMAAAEQARNARCDMVIGLGGGSVIDTGKVAATMLTNTGLLTDYL